MNFGIYFFSIFLFLKYYIFSKISRLLSFVSILVALLNSTGELNIDELCLNGMSILLEGVLIFFFSYFCFELVVDPPSGLLLLEGGCLCQ